MKIGCEPKHLVCQGCLVGDIDDPFFSDGTWYGSLTLRIGEAGNPPARRILEFISFSEEWNEATSRDLDDPPDASEFDRFSDLIQDGLWRAKCADGTERPIAAAPVFVKGGEISWQFEGDSGVRA